ncbi:MAG: hypothetical protein P8Y94_00360 [Acidobacteriota bacterium]
MSKQIALICTTFVVFSIIAADSARAQGVEKTETTESYRLELEVLPPEPFFSHSDVQSQQIKSGMLIVRGAAPVQPDAVSKPNHHLIVHVFDKSTGKAVTDANVKMSFQRLGPAGEPIGMPTEVPVVEMQVIGKGPATTHYGNNVIMPSGTYRVNITANGESATFKVSL